MTAEQFLTWLEQKDLVSAKEIAELRRQMSGSSRHVSAKSVAILLQARGYLTASQAKRLLREASQVDTTAPTDASEPTPSQGAPPVGGMVETNGTGAGAQPLLLADTGDEGVIELLSAPPPPPAPAATAVRHDAAPAPEEEPTHVFDLEAAVAIDDTGRRHGSPWDSPLLLVGGGVLILLVLTGVTLIYLINRGGGDTLLKMAEADYHNGSYAQAVEKYNQFLKRFPHHPSASLGTVHCGLARIRKAIQSTSDGGQRLVIAKRVLEEIDQEREFPAARAELASLLPDIAEGLAQQARTSKEAAVAMENVDLATEALGLVTNTNYVPRTLFPDRRVEGIRELLNLVRKDLDRDRALVAALSDIRSAVRSGDTRKAYEVRAVLLKDYPTLSTDVALGETVLEIARAERSNIKTVDQAIAASTEDPLPSALALAACAGAPPAGASATPVLVTAAGAVYGLDGSSGRVRWRRPVGFNPEAVPTLLADQERGRALLVDTVRNELVCVETATGRLQWRFPVGERFATPAVTKDRIFVAARSGKLFVLEPASGTSSKHVVLPQTLAVPPALDHQQGIIYQLGGQSSLYVLAHDDLGCREVFCLGHSAGTVRVPPVVVMNQVIVAENLGNATTMLHVLARSEVGADAAPPDQNEANRTEPAEHGAEDSRQTVLKRVQQIRLTGHVLTPPAVDGRLLAVTTDRGMVRLFEVASRDGHTPLTPVAEQPAADEEPLARYLLLRNGQLWIAGAQLTEYQIQPQAGQLAPVAIERSYRGAAFDDPLQLAGELLVHVRRQSGQHAVTVAATEIAGGKQVWETELGMRPVGEPVVTAEQGKIALVTSAGALFQLDKNDMQTGVADGPLRAPPRQDGGLPLTHQIDLGPGRTAYVSDAGGRAVLVCDLRGGDNPPSLNWLSTPGELACAPCAFGNGLLAPTQRGQVLWLDLAAGGKVAEPFQPPLRQAGLPVWHVPCVIGENGREFVVADALGKLYRVGVKDEPMRQLVGLAETSHLSDPVVTPPVVLAGAVFVATAAGRLLPFTLPELEPGEPIDLGGRPTWGPRVVGDHLLVVTEQDELLCVDRKQNLLWRSKLCYGPLAGTPLATGDQYALTSGRGTLWRVDAATGRELAHRDLGQPLGTGPVLLGQQLIVAARAGAILLTEMP